MSTILGDMAHDRSLAGEMREYHVARRRALLAELAAEEKLLGIEKPVVYVPIRLHPLDRQALTKHFRIIEEERPSH